jgi:DNA-binding transcriptional ArsR family regulator
LPIIRDERDRLFKTLADASRRLLLDPLYASNGQTLTELCEHLDMTRQAVTQHLEVFQAANLVTTVWRGREKLHYLNPVPLQEIYERWIGKFEKPRLSALHKLKKRLEVMIMNKSEFVYVVYIRTKPERLWSALTSPEFMKQYWFGTHFETDWKSGSPWQLVFPMEGSQTPARLQKLIHPSVSYSNGATNSGQS